MLQGGTGCSIFRRPRMIWRRAQSRRRVGALQRAARRPFLIVGALGAIYSVVLLLWGLFQLPESVYRLFIASPGLNEDVALAAQYCQEYSPLRDRVYWYLRPGV